MIRQLILALKREIMRRYYHLEVLRNSWVFLGDRGVEETLSPIGMGLAWSLELDHCQQPALERLIQIRNLTTIDFTLVRLSSLPRPSKIYPESQLKGMIFEQPRLYPHSILDTITKLRNYRQ
jgi:hypothetical protein